MASKLIQKIVPISTGGSVAVSVEDSCDTVHIKPATAITLSSALNIAVDGTPISNTEITFIYGGNITTDTSTGKSVNIFGTELTDAQAAYEGEIKAYYNGSAWEIKIFPDAESGLSNLDGSGLVSGSVATAAIANDAVTNDKLNSMTRGTVKVGGTSNAPTDLDAKTSGYILVGDGTDLNSVATSGDVTIDSAGVMTIGAGKVTTAMLATPFPDILSVKVSLNAAQLLAATKVDAVAAPGAGYAIEVICASVKYTHVSTAYDVGTNIVIFNDTATNSQTKTPDILGLTASNFSKTIEIIATTTNQLVENKKLQVSSNLASTVGDGTADVYITYRIIEL